ncbi:MAG: DUF937 domain-containing protein [Actinobacteria bacterium]|nr:DUF937 domain-containing protein [Actinomycetota bacterium]
MNPVSMLLGMLFKRRNGLSAGGPLLGALVSMVAGGGLNGILGKFRGVGLASRADSWVSSGPNAALSGDEVQQALGSDQVSQLAGETGMSEEGVKSGLADMLPKLVNGLTPGGGMPDAAALAKMLRRVGG